MPEPLNEIGTSIEVKHDFSSIESIAKKYDVFFVHKIVPRLYKYDKDNDDDDSWSPIREGVTDPEILAKIVLATRPEISASTIKVDDSHENFFKMDEGIGLLLVGGKVTFAAATDSFTSFGEKNSRRQTGRVPGAFIRPGGSGLTPFAERLTGKHVEDEEDIELAINFRFNSWKEANSGRYSFTPFNEFSIKHPLVGAVFVVFEDKSISTLSGKSMLEPGERNEDDLIREYDDENNSFLILHREFENLETAQKVGISLGIPTLIFYKGNFYRVEKTDLIDPENALGIRLFLGKKITPQEALTFKDPLQQNPEKRPDIIKELYSLKPFRDTNVARLRNK